MSDDIQFLGCPYCGDPVEPEGPDPEDPRTSWFIACHNLSCVQPWDAAPTKEELAESWNRRAYPPQTQAVIDELVSLLTDPSVGPLTPGIKHCMVDVDRETFLREQGMR